MSDIAEELYAWMFSPSLEESRAILEAHPEFLTDESYHHVQQIAALSWLEDSPLQASHLLLAAAIAGTARRSGVAATYRDAPVLAAKLQELQRLLDHVDDVEPRHPDHIHTLEMALELGNETSLSGCLALNYRLGCAHLERRNFTRAVDFLRLAAKRREGAESFWSGQKHALAVALSELSQQLNERDGLAASIEAMDWLLESGAAPETARLQQTAGEVGYHYFLKRDWVRAGLLLSLSLERFDELFASYSPMSRDGVAGHMVGMSAALAYSTVRVPRRDRSLLAARALERSRLRGQGLVLHREATLRSSEGVISEALHAKLRQATLRLDLAERIGAESSTLQGIARTGMQVHLDRQAAEIPRLQEFIEATEEYQRVCNEVESVFPGSLPARESQQMPDAARLLQPDEGVAYVGHTEAGGVAILWTRTETGNVGRVWADDQLTTAVVQDCLARTERSLLKRKERGLLAAQIGRASMPEEVEAAIKALDRPESVICSLALASREIGLTHLILVPCGNLTLLPLHAVPVPGLLRGARGPLADVVRISYAHSVEAWCLGRMRTGRQGQGRVRALVVSDPQPLPGNVPPLPFAAKEGQFLADLVSGIGGAEVVALNSTSATRAQVMDAVRTSAEPVTHAHFACHAFANILEPKRSGLLLSEGEVLTVFELGSPAGRPVSSLRLAVMAACQTAVVGTDLVDEAIGLPTAWFQVGAATVVASLWPMSDAATFAIMKKFYQLHLIDQLPPSQSLWLAQRWLRGLATWRQEFRDAGATHSAELPDVAEERRDAGSSARAWDHPVYWAGFVCYGD